MRRVKYNNLKVGDVVDFETLAKKNPERGNKMVGSATVVKLYRRVALCRTEFGYMICVSRVRPSTVSEVNEITAYNEFVLAMQKEKERNAR